MASGVYNEDPNDPRVAERNRNRKMLAELHDAHHKFVQDSEAEIARMKSEFDGMRRRMGEEQGKIKHEMLQEQSKIKHELALVEQEKAALKSAVVTMNGEMHWMKGEFQKMTGKMTEYDKNTSDLKKGLHSKDDIVRLDSKTGLVMNDLRLLTRQLLDRGILGPPKPEEPPEDDKPPVGTIELDEDIYTARLMLKLGFMRGQSEAYVKKLEGSDYETDGEQEELMELAHFENVQGLMVPEIEKDDPGYIWASTGWLGVCVGTTCIQWLILLIMVTHGLKSEECFHEPPDLSRWWLLHSSKAFAMCITGVLMGKEVMGITNYAMVSELMEPKRSFEVCVTTLAQLALTVTVVAANVFIFLGLTSPVDVWTNMAALGFIQGLDAEMLTVAKGGIFGHHIAKAVTPINFQLHFVSHYPTWFAYVRGITVLLVAAFVVGTSFFVFVTPDPMCPESA